MFFGHSLLIVWSRVTVVWDVYLEISVPCFYLETREGLFCMWREVGLQQRWCLRHNNKKSKQRQTLATMKFQFSQKHEIYPQLETCEYFVSKPRIWLFFSPFCKHMLKDGGTVAANSTFSLQPCSYPAGVKGPCALSQYPQQLLYVCTGLSPERSPQLSVAAVAPK